MRFLVTGGAGFVGQHLVAELIKNDDNRVDVLDDFSSGKMENLLPFGKRVGILKYDIREAEFVRRAIIKKSYDVIINLAAASNVKAFDENPTRSFEVNVNGFLHILNAARFSGSRVVYASSAAVYGNGSVPNKESARAMPDSHYALSKYMCDEFASMYSRIHGVHTTGLRFFNVYGAGEGHKGEDASVVHKLVLAATEGNKPVIYGTGSQTRDFVYVGDVIQAILLACFRQPIPRFALYNVGIGHGATIKELVSLVGKTWGRPLVPTRVSTVPKGHIENSVSDITHITQDLGYEPHYSLEQGLKEMKATWKKKE